MLNRAIITQPLNWFVVLSMLLVAGYTGHLILSHYHDEKP